MIPPVSYTGWIEVDGNVKSYLHSLDPQNWQENVPEIWRNSYLIGPPPLPVAGLPLASRAATPPRIPGKPDQWPWRLFFEDVVVVGLQYRNILDTRLRQTLDAHRRLVSFEFQYRQYDCLQTRSTGGVDDGGIDVDYGGSSCWYGNNGKVNIQISKTVRYTEPSYLYGELNGLSHVLTPLVFDGWLHQMLFG
jgi:hypothetical protein